jgi:membrane protein implicated in regulation of membrane protease activity
VLKAINPFGGGAGTYAWAGAIFLATGIIETALGAWWIGLVDLLVVGVMAWMAVRTARRQGDQEAARRTGIAAAAQIINEIDARLGADLPEAEKVRLGELRSRAVVLLGELQALVA